MITDIHSHAWKYPEHFSESFRQQSKQARGDVEVDLTVKYEDYVASAGEDVKTVVFGGKAKLSGLWVPDDYVADYVKQNPKSLVGFLSLDPTQPGWKDELKRGHQELGLKGIKLMPMYAGFRPDHVGLGSLWGYATENNLPVLLHTGTTFVSQARLENTLPRHVDNAAINFPEAKIVMAHLAHPFMEECVVVARKHKNVYADVSALHYRPKQLYDGLMAIQEYGVWDKLLFGTDYPFTNVRDSVAGLRSLNEEVGAKLRLDEKEIEKMIYRDGLKELGVEN